MNLHVLLVVIISIDAVDWVPFRTFNDSMRSGAGVWFATSSIAFNDGFVDWILLDSKSIICATVVSFSISLSGFALSVVDSSSMFSLLLAFLLLFLSSFCVNDNDGSDDVFVFIISISSDVILNAFDSFIMTWYRLSLGSKVVKLSLLATTPKISERNIIDMD